VYRPFSVVCLLKFLRINRSLDVNVLLRIIIVYNVIIVGISVCFSWALDPHLVNIIGFFSLVALTLCL